MASSITSAQFQRWTPALQYHFIIEWSLSYEIPSAEHTFNSSKIQKSPSMCISKHRNSSSTIDISDQATKVIAWMRVWVRVKFTVREWEWELQCEAESERPVGDRKENITRFLCHCFGVLYTGKLMSCKPSARHVERRLTILLRTPYLHHTHRQTDVRNILWISKQNMKINHSCFKQWFLVLFLFDNSTGHTIKWRIGRQSDVLRLTLWRSTRLNSSSAHTAHTSTSSSLSLSSSTLFFFTTFLFLVTSASPV